MRHQVWYSGERLSPWLEFILVACLVTRHPQDLVLPRRRSLPQTVLEPPHLQVQNQ